MISMTRAIRLDLAYEGTRYHGFGAQPGQDTIQAVLERALASILGEATRVTAAGRTSIELRDEIHKRLLDGYLRDPIVSVTLTEAASRRISVFGQVQKAGTIAWEIFTGIGWRVERVNL